MATKIYNSLTRKIEEFKPIRPGAVSLYCCGPTVHNFVHIGNLRAAVFFDLVRRYFKFRGFKLTHVINITDVDDKTIRSSKKVGKSLKEFTESYTKAYLEDLNTLNIEIPEIMPRATAEIDGMVDMIETLLKKGHAYKTEKGDIYFKISTNPDYGKLANIDLSQVKENAGGRLSTADEYDKENVSDFALWKAWDEEDGDVFWDTTIGKGRPGWHIECSVMSAKYLGQPFDIHCGGIDLLFPHHTNEIAQSECAMGGTFVNYWLHNEHLIVNGKKMSKSLGNFFTLRDLLEKDYSPRAIRYELIKTHYRQQLDFRPDNFSQNLQVLKKFDEFLERLAAPSSGAGWGQLKEVMTKAETAFTDALDDDLNVSNAFTAIFDFMSAVNKAMERLSSAEKEQASALMLKFDSVLGLLRPAAKTQDAQVENLLKEREEARKRKDFKRSDEIRDELSAKGIIIKDTPQGTTWRKA